MVIFRAKLHCIFEPCLFLHIYKPSYSHQSLKKLTENTCLFCLIGNSWVVVVFFPSDPKHMGANFLLSANIHARKVYQYCCEGVVSLSDSPPLQKNNKAQNAEWWGKSSENVMRKKTGKQMVKFRLEKNLPPQKLGGMHVIHIPKNPHIPPE